ncbi:MAG: hypothetical protein J07HQX50_00236 [Haloquadratum sp. J07HQX50]|nr:MAG: hypothetical protein J07HQX50_00236 [Haloquadratum sp. J07HQX50]
MAAHNDRSQLPEQRGESSETKEALELSVTRASLNETVTCTGGND